jgi:hypothetical protein
MVSAAPNGNPPNVGAQQPITLPLSFAARQNGNRGGADCGFTNPETVLACVELMARRERELPRPMPTPRSRSGYRRGRGGTLPPAGDR